MGKKKVKEEESSILKCNADEVFSDSEGEEKHVSRKKIEHHKKKEESSSEDENVSEDEQIDKKINGHNESSSSSSEGEEEEEVETESKIEKQESVSEVSKDLEPGFSKVSVIHRWVGSLEEFSKHPERAISELNEHTKSIFNATIKENDISSKSGPKISHKQHILKDIRLKKIKNTFGQEIMISIKGIDTNDQKTFSTSTSEKSGVHVAFKGEDIQKMDKVLIEGNKIIADHKFLKQYPGWNSDNIRERIMDIHGDTTCLVAVGHPVLKVYEDTIKATGKKAQLEMVNGKNYVMEKGQVNACVEIIKEQLEKNIKMVNLADLQFEISRAFHDPKLGKGEAWVDLSVGFEGIDTNDSKNLKTIKAAKDQVGYLTAEFEITFKNC